MVDSLRPRVVGRFQATAISIASTAPAYSLAATLGLLVTSVGVAAPWPILVAFLLALLTSLAFRELNIAEPDCGTIFIWVSRALGPRLGWMAGWTSIAACVIVMTSLVQVSIFYMLCLLGLEHFLESQLLQVGLGFVLVAGLTEVVRRGIVLAAKLQSILVFVELSILCIFVVVASLSIGHPTAVPRAENDWVTAIIASIFMYWGWDSAFSINEESTDRRGVPGFAAVFTTIGLLLTYIAVAHVAASLMDGHGIVAGEDAFDALASNLPMSEVLGPLLAFSILVSAIGSAQGTIIPSARTIFGMARRNALPPHLSHVHPKYRTPDHASLWFSVSSITLYIGLLLLSENATVVSVEATGILICLYYGATCLAVPVYFIRCRNRHRVVMRMVLPTIAGLIFVGVTVYSLLDARPPALVASGTVLLGMVLMALNGSSWARTLGQESPGPF